MKVMHNGEEIEIPEGMTGIEFLRKFQYRRSMIKLNGEQMQTATFSKVVLQDDDDVVVKRISGVG